MKTWRAGFLVIFFAIFGTSADAQDPGQIFDFLQNQIQNQAARQQQRQFERQQQQQNQQLYEEFDGAWEDCFHAKNSARCDEALQYPYLSADDRQHLNAQRAQLAAEAEEQRERERQAQIEAANEQQRLQLEREQAQKEQDTNEMLMTAFKAVRASCYKDRELSQCDEALRFPRLSDGERKLLNVQRAFVASLVEKKLEQERRERAELLEKQWHQQSNARQDETEQAGQREAGVPKVLATTDDRGESIGSHAPSSSTTAVDTLITTGSLALAKVEALPTLVRDVPLSTQITGGVASLLALTLAWVLARRAPAVSATPGPANGSTSPPRQRKRRSSLWHSLRRATHRTTVRVMARRRKAKPVVTVAAHTLPSLPPPLPPAVVNSNAPRDTQTAVDAMELAHAYMIEFHDEIGEAITDPAFAARTLNTLSLVSRQLDIAERADPSATLTVEDKNGNQTTFNLDLLKSAALSYEATCRISDNPKRAIQLFEQCLQLDPSAASAHFFIGMLHADMFHKAQAIASFEKALILDPRNLEYRKALARAQAISGSQVAFDRAVTGTRKTVSFARWTWTGFVMIALISFISALLRGDPGPAVAIFFIFVVFGLFSRSITAAKEWFGSFFRL